MNEIQKICCQVSVCRWVKTLVSSHLSTTATTVLSVSSLAVSKPNCWRNWMISVCSNLLNSNKVRSLPERAYSNPGTRREVKKECFLSTLPRILICGYEVETKRRNQKMLENSLWGIAVCSAPCWTHRVSTNWKIITYSDFTSLLELSNTASQSAGRSYTDRKILPWPWRLRDWLMHQALHFLGQINQLIPSMLRLDVSKALAKYHNTIKL